MFMRAIGFFMSFLVSLAWVGMLIVAGAVLVFVFGASQGHASENASEYRSEVWSTVPGTSARKNLEYLKRDGTLYRPIPGTRTPDYGSDERWIVRDNKVYKAIPGTNTPDYRSRRYIIR